MTFLHRPVYVLELLGYKCNVCRTLGVFPKGSIVYLGIIIQAKQKIRLWRVYMCVLLGLEGETEGKGNMAEAKHLIQTTSSNQIPTSRQPRSNCSENLHPQFLKVKAASRKQNDRSSLISKKGPKSPHRHLITISTADQRWHGKWSCDYVFSLRDLQLGDLVEVDQHKDALVYVNLSIHKHASFGLSVEGRIVASLTRRCSNCSTPYCRHIDTSFNVWVLGSSREDSKGDEFSDNYPSVIYVKPGYEANLDSLVQDTIRLNVSSKETCSEVCEKSGPTIQYGGRQYKASTTQRWQRLLKLKNQNL